MMNYCQTLSEFAHSTLQSQFCSETDRNRLQLEHVLYFLRPHLPHEYFQGCSHCCCDSLHNRDCLACLYGRGRPKRGGKWQFLWSYIASLDFKCAKVLDSIMSTFQLVKKTNNGKHMDGVQSAITEVDSPQVGTLGAVVLASSAAAGSAVYKVVYLYLYCICFVFVVVFVSVFVSHIVHRVLYVM